MNKFKILLTLICTLFLCACSEDVSFTANRSDCDEIDFSTSIQATELNSRVVMDENGKGSFSENDRITLLTSTDMGLSWASYTMTCKNGAWLPKLTWREVGSNNVMFSAFYPAIASTDATSFVHTPALNQTSTPDYQNSDLLYAYTSVSSRQEVKLSFKHLMSRLCITLTCDDSFTPEDLDNAQIKIQAINGIEIMLKEGTQGQLLGNMQKITAHKNNNKFYAVLCPQPVADSWKTKEWLEITIGDRTFTYKAPEKLSDGRTFNELKSGMQINLNINLKQKAEETEWKNKTVWVYGIKNPPVENWGYISPYPCIEKGLKWKPEFGWFDCNKIDPDNTSNIDSEMCWAAAASNTLYWWLAQNKTYIDRFGKYNGPNQYASLDSDIFKMYRKEFGNKSMDVAAAFDWFITGKFGMDFKEGAGFFREVFGPVHVAHITRFAEKSFSEELKYSFTHKEGIECSFNIPGMMTHAISIWGADFDENGEVCAIYITENNDRYLDEQNEFTDYKGRPVTQAGIIRKRVMKKNNEYYIESSVENHFTFKIVELNTLSLMQDKWEEYFKKY